MEKESFTVHARARLERLQPGWAILIGLLIRLPLVFVHGYAADMFGWEKLIQNVAANGLPHVYAIALRQPGLGVYPPLYHYALALVGLIYRWLFSPDFAAHPLALDLLIKGVPVVGDGLVALAVYALARQLADERAARWAMLAFMLNPAIIYNSAYWGMFGDSLYTLFILLALLAAHRQHSGLAWGAITLGILFKPQAIVFVPLVAWTTLRPVALGQWVRAGAAAGLTCGVIWLPFILAGTAPEAVAALSQTTDLFPFLSANAHNVWYFFSAGNSWTSDTRPLVGLVSARVIGLAALGAAYLLALYRLKSARGWPVLATAAFIAFAFFMLLTQMHENYAYPAVTLVAAAWPWSRRLKKLAVLLTLTTLANMVLHDPPLQGSLSGWPYLVLISLTILNSGVNVFVFIWWTGRLAFKATAAEAMAASPAPPTATRRRYCTALSVMVAVTIFGLAAYSVGSLFARALTRPAPLTPQQVAAIPHRLDVTFENKVRLVGYAADMDAGHPGESLAITLYWQALAPLEDGYAVFIHLANPAGALSGQSDVPLGLDNLPPGQWRPGETFACRYRVDIRETAYAPDELVVRAGLYIPPAGPRLAARDANGNPISDNAVHLWPVKLMPRPGALPNPAKINFGRQVALVGYDLSSRVIRPGETFSVTLYWEALARMQRDYQVFAHILGPGDQVMATNDGPPLTDPGQMSRWSPGQVIREVRPLTLSAHAPPGLYDIEVGVFTMDEGRLPVIAPGLREVRERLVLVQVRVTGK